VHLYICRAGALCWDLEFVRNVASGVSVCTFPLYPSPALDLTLAGSTLSEQRLELRPHSRGAAGVFRHWQNLRTDRMNQQFFLSILRTPQRKLSQRIFPCAFVLCMVCVLAIGAFAQSRNYTSVSGTVVDPSGAVVPDATVEIRNPVSQFERSVTTDSSGAFSIPNIPFNPYHMTVARSGFASYAQDLDLRSPLPVNLKINLQLATAVQTVTVESNGADLIENDPTFHTDVDRSLFDKLPLESASSSVTSLVTLASPGIAADSNGLMHGLGDHAENS